MVYIIIALREKRKKKIPWRKEGTMTSLRVRTARGILIDDSLRKLLGRQLIAATESGTIVGRLTIDRNGFYAIPDYIYFLFTVRHKKSFRTNFVILYRSHFECDFRVLCTSDYQQVHELMKQLGLSGTVMDHAVIDLMFGENGKILQDLPELGPF
jgi:hypothetical protein